MRARVSCYRDLKVWQRAMELMTESYALARRFPRSEIYGLRDQLQRAAVSIPANIAEGNGRMRRADYIRYLLIANGSLRELETYLHAAERLSYLQPGALTGAFALSAEVSRMLVGLIRALQVVGPRT